MSKTTPGAAGPAPERAPRLSRRATLRGLGAGLAGAALAAPLLAAQAQEATPVTTEMPPFPPDDEQALEAIVARHLTEEQIPGVVVGVWIPDRGRLVHAAGVGDRTTSRPIASDDRFRIASVTKTFTATAVLQLVDAGKISLDDRLESFVPGIPNGDRITIEQVLGMTAGIFNYVEDPAFAAAYTADPLMPFTPEDAVDIVRRHQPDFPPGTSIKYSDTNYMLLGPIVAQVTGQPVEVVLAESVIAPLGLAATSYPTTPEIPAPHARGYAADPSGSGLRDVTRSNPDVPGGAGAMISTLDDLRVWAKALAVGTLLDPETQQARLRWTPFPSRGLPAAYGLGVLQFAGFIGHNGSIFGYSTWMMYLPEADATIVVLTNRAETQSETASGIFLDIARLLFPEQFPAPATPAAA